MEDVKFLVFQDQFAFSEYELEEELSEENYDGGRGTC